jgi:hypothetical protein
MFGHARLPITLPFVIRMALIKAKVGLLPPPKWHVHVVSPHRNEAAWWEDAGIDPAKAARKL